MTSADRTAILFVGDDPALAYLLERYGQRSGNPVYLSRGPIAPAEVSARQAGVVWFSSLVSLEASQAGAVDWAGDDTPLVVWATITDEARAYELGADYCALHPFTYQDFLTALAAVGVATDERRAPAV